MSFTTLEHACLNSLPRLGQSTSLHLKVNSVFTCPSKTTASIMVAMDFLKSGGEFCFLADKRSLAVSVIAVVALTRVSYNAENFMSCFLTCAPSLFQISGLTFGVCRESQLLEGWIFLQNFLAYCQVECSSELAINYFG